MEEVNPQGFLPERSFKRDDVFAKRYHISCLIFRVRCDTEFCRLEVLV